MRFGMVKILIPSFDCKLMVIKLNVLFFILYVYIFKQHNYPYQNVNPDNSFVK